MSNRNRRPPKPQIIVAGDQDYDELGVGYVTDIPGLTWLVRSDDPENFDADVEIPNACAELEKVLSGEKAFIRITSFDGFPHIITRAGAEHVIQVATMKYKGARAARSKTVEIVRASQLPPPER